MNDHQMCCCVICPRHEWCYVYLAEAFCLISSLCVFICFCFCVFDKKINKCESWDRAGPNILYAALNVNLPKTVFIKDYHKQQVSSSIISNSLTIYHIISPWNDNVRWDFAIFKGGLVDFRFICKIKSGCAIIQQQ